MLIHYEQGIKHQLYIHLIESFNIENAQIINY